MRGIDRIGLSTVLERGEVYPACAGIDRFLLRFENPQFCLPLHARDRPSLFSICDIVDPFTPHARGSTILFHMLLDLYWVYPGMRGDRPL